MAVIDFVDKTESLSATHAEVHDEWVIARVTSEDGETERHCFPRERIERIVGVGSGDDVTVES